MGERLSYLAEIHPANDKAHTGDNANGPVEIRPYGLCLFVTNCAHAAFAPSDGFGP